MLTTNTVQAPRFRLGLLLWLAGMLGAVVLTVTVLPQLFRELPDFPRPCGCFAREPRAERGPLRAGHVGGRRARAEGWPPRAGVRGRRGTPSARARAQAATSARPHRRRCRRNPAVRRFPIRTRRGGGAAAAVHASAPRSLPVRRLHRGAPAALGVHDGPGVAGVAAPAAPEQAPRGSSTSGSPSSRARWCSARVTCRQRRC